VVDITDYVSICEFQIYLLNISTLDYSLQLSHGFLKFLLKFQMLLLWLFQ